MKITGLKALILEPRENHHQEVPEYVVSKTRQNGVAIISTDEGIDGVVSSEASNVRRLAQLWAGAREHIEGQDPFDRGKIAWTLRRRFQLAAASAWRARLRPLGHRRERRSTSRSTSCSARTARRSWRTAPRSTTTPMSGSSRRPFGARRPASRRSSCTRTATSRTICAWSTRCARRSATTSR